MKKLLILFAMVGMVLSCADKEKKAEEKTEEKVEGVTYASFGDKITDDGVISKEEMAKKFETMKDGDTITVKFASNINSVCKKKGCWMKLDLPNDKESMVRFKDYGFFVPLNADNKEAIVEGKAFVTTISVDQLKHYAEDGGKSEEEIAKITEPKVTYAFEATGVLIEE